MVVIQGDALAYGLLSLITFAGALLYGLVMQSRRTTSLAEVSKVKDLFVNLRDVFLFAAFPAALIGSLLHADQLENISFVDIFSVYLIAETAGIVLFAPVACAYLSGQFSVDLWRRPNMKRQLTIVMLVTCLPVMAHWLGQPEYAQGLYLLVFPIISWIAVKNDNRLTLTTLLIITLSHLTFETNLLDHIILPKPYAVKTTLTLAS